MLLLDLFRLVRTVIEDETIFCSGAGDSGQLAHQYEQLQQLQQDWPAGRHLGYLHCQTMDNR
jgi:hypothetical protein